MKKLSFISIFVLALFVLVNSQFAVAAEGFVPTATSAHPATAPTATAGMLDLSGDCVIDYAPVGATAAQKKSFTFKYEFIGIFLETKEFHLLRKCETNIVEPQIRTGIPQNQFTFVPNSSNGTTAKIQNCSVPTTTPAEAETLKKILTNNTPNTAEYNAAIKELDRLNDKKTVTMIVDCEKFFQSNPLTAYAGKEKLAAMTTEVETLQKSYTAECTSGVLFWRSHSNLNGCPERKAKIQSLSEEISQLDDKQIAGENRLKNGSSRKFACIPAPLNTNIATDQTKYCQAIKTICSQYDAALAAKLTCGPAGSVRPDQTMSGCKDGAAAGKNMFGENVCVCPSEDTSTSPPVYLNEKCTAPSETVCKEYDRRYVFQDGKCKACPGGQITTDGKTCGTTSTTPPPATTQCTATAQCSAGPCESGTCVSCAASGQTFNGTRCVLAGPIAPPASGDCPTSHPNKYDNKCYPVCSADTEFVDGQCTRKQTTPAPTTDQQACTQSGRKWEGNSCSPKCLEQGYVLNGTNCVQSQGCQQQGGQIQNGICMFPNPNNNNNQNQQKAQQCVQKGGTWANNECLPGTPNAQQPKGTPQQQQQAAQQAAQQQQQQQAQQQCLAQGGQWNGTQCLPPAFNPYTSPYYNQQTSNKPTCNFFGASLTEVPLGETVDIMWEVTNASTISLDTSPKSSTKYIKGDAASSSSTLGAIGNSISSSLGGSSLPQTTIIGATVKPSKKGTLTVRLKVNNLLQNSDPCKPIKLSVVDPSTSSSSDVSYANDTTQTSQATYLDETATNNSSGIGEEVELASDIAQQKRDAAQQLRDKAAAEAKPSVTKATYENLCAMFGIGCGGADEATAQPVTREVVATTQTPVEKLTINPSDVGVDVPNVGADDGQATTSGFNATNQTNGDNTIVVAYDPNVATQNAVTGYVEEASKYAPDGTVTAGTTGQLKQAADTGETTTTTKPGVFTRMWRWFIGLLGFGAEQV